jgi:hypothetical protein
MADNGLGDFASLSVDGHKQMLAAKEKHELQEKLMKRAEQHRMQQQMQPPKPVHAPQYMINAFNKNVHKKDDHKTRMQINRIKGKVEKYYVHFGEYALKGRKKMPFTSSTTLEEAQEELASVEGDLASASSYNNVENTYLYGLDMLQAIGPKAGLRTHNAKAVLGTEKNLDIVRPELIEISIKYEEWFQQGPLLRLAQKIGYMVKAVHNANKEEEAKQLNTPASPDLINRCNSL